MEAEHRKESTVQETIMQLLVLANSAVNERKTQIKAGNRGEI